MLGDLVAEDDLNRPQLEVEDLVGDLDHGMPPVGMGVPLSAGHEQVHGPERIAGTGPMTAHHDVAGGCRRRLERRGGDRRGHGLRRWHVRELLDPAGIVCPDADEDRARGSDASVDVHVHLCQGLPVRLVAILAGCPHPVT